MTKLESRCFTITIGLIILAIFLVALAIASVTAIP